MVCFTSEPHPGRLARYPKPPVDEEIFRAMLKEAGVEVHFRERIREQEGVELQGDHLVLITTSDGTHWRAKVFADCSYEGDADGAG